MTAEEIIRRALDANGVVPFIGKTGPMDFEPNPRDARRKHRQFLNEKEQEARKQAEHERRLLLRQHREIIEQARNTGFEYRAILSAVCMVHNIPLADILSAKRSNKIASARHHAAWELHTRKRFTRTKIGQILHRDQSSITHSIETVEGRKDLFANKIMVLDQLLTKLGANHG